MLPKKLKKVISPKKSPPIAPLRPLVLVQKLEQAQTVPKKSSSKAKRVLAFFKLKKNKKSGAISAEYVVVELEDGRSSMTTVSTKANSFSSSTRSGSAPPPHLASVAVNLPIAAAFCTPEPRRFTIDNPSKALRPTIPLSPSLVFGCRTEFEVPRSLSLNVEAAKIIHKGDDGDAPTPALLSVTSRPHAGVKSLRLSAASLPAIPSRIPVDCAPVNVYQRNNLKPLRLSAKPLPSIASSLAAIEAEVAPVSSAPTVSGSTAVISAGLKPLLLAAAAGLPSQLQINPTDFLPRHSFASRIPRLVGSTLGRSVLKGVCPHCGSSSLVGSIDTIFDVRSGESGVLIVEEGVTEVKRAHEGEVSQIHEQQARPAIRVTSESGIHIEGDEDAGEVVLKQNVVIQADVEAVSSTDGDERSSVILNPDSKLKEVGKGEMGIQTDPPVAPADTNAFAITVKMTAESGIQTESEVELVGDVHVNKNATRTLVDASTQTDVDAIILSSYVSSRASAPAPAPAPAPLPPPPPPPPPPPKTSLSRKFFRRADVVADTKASVPGNAKVSSEPTGGNYLSELKDRLARRNTRTTTLTVSPSQTRTASRRSSSFSKFAAVKIRRHAHRNDENAKPEEEGELLRLFRQKKANGGRRIALGALDPNTSMASNNTTNTITTTRKLRRIVVPPVEEGAVSSRNPQIQNELERLRAQAKVGGVGGGGGSGSRAAGDKEKQKNVITGLENPTGTK